MQRMGEMGLSGFISLPKNCIADLYPDSTIQACSLCFYHGNHKTAFSTRPPLPLVPSLLFPSSHQGMDAAEPLARFALSPLHTSAGMDAWDEARGRSASIGTEERGELRECFSCFRVCGRQPGPCSHAGCSGQAQRPASKGLETTLLLEKMGPEEKNWVWVLMWECLQGANIWK